MQKITSLAFILKYYFYISLKALPKLRLYFLCILHVLYEYINWTLFLQYSYTLVGSFVILRKTLTNLEHLEIIIAVKTDIAILRFFLHWIDIIKLYCIYYFIRRKFYYCCYFNLSQNDFIIERRKEIILQLLFVHVTYRHLKINNPTFFKSLIDKNSTSEVIFKKKFNFISHNFWHVE